MSELTEKMVVNNYRHLNESNNALETIFKAKGLTGKEVAKIIGVSEKTYNSVIKKDFKKMGILILLGWKKDGRYIRLDQGIIGLFQNMCRI